MRLAFFSGRVRLEARPGKERDVVAVTRAQRQSRAAGHDDFAAGWQLFATPESPRLRLTCAWREEGHTVYGVDDSVATLNALDSQLGVRGWRTGHDCGAAEKSQQPEQIEVAG